MGVAWGSHGNRMGLLTQKLNRFVARPGNISIKPFFAYPSSRKQSTGFAYPANSLQFHEILGLEKRPMSSLLTTPVNKNCQMKEPFYPKNSTKGTLNKRILWWNGLGGWLKVIKGRAYLCFWIRMMWQRLILGLMIGFFEDLFMNVFLSGDPKLENYFI